MLRYISSPDGAKLVTVDTPSCGPEDILVRVRAACFNRIDLALATGASHGQAGGMAVPLGSEWAGEIVEIGDKVEGRQVGDRVMGVGAGAFSEYLKANAGFVYDIPAGMSFEQAAAFPVAMQTMYDAIFNNGELKPGQSVMIQGASSAVGLLAMQIAKILGAGFVIGSSTTEQRRARLADFGADLAVDSSSEDWVERVLDATGNAGVDLLVDQVSGPVMIQNLSATRIGGRIVNVGRLGGDSAPFNFDLHALRRITYVGITFRTRTIAEIEQIIADTGRVLGPSLANGSLRMPIDQVFPFEQAADAYAFMARNAHLGKIVLAGT